METNYLVPILTTICCIIFLVISVKNFIKMLKARKINRDSCGVFEISFAILCIIAGSLGIIFSVFLIGKCDNYNKKVSETIRTEISITDNSDEN